ncbi:MAG TPA: HEAT repeat domain-containing protein [Polyangia bacterium]
MVARAARLVKEHRLDGFAGELEAAFDRFMSDPVKSDPTCAAKIAAIEALDFGEADDAAPFLRAVVHEQWEGGNDTAAPMRARAVLALARIGHPDFDLVAAQLLTDRTAPVRQAALDALVHRGDRANAALALLKLRSGDEDPLVTLAAMTALLTLAPARGLDALRDLLDAENEEQRELAAIALGQSRSDEALTALLSALERCTRSEERAAILRGAGLHRSDRALDALVEVIAGSHEVDARAAIDALGARRFERGLAERVRAAAARNERADLSAFVDSVFATP